MRMRRRRSRRRLAVGATVAYLCLIAWLLSPLWRSGTSGAAPQTSMRPAPAGQPLGAFSLSRADAIPSELPGYTPPKEASRPAGGEVETLESGGSESEPVEPAGESAAAGRSEEASAGTAEEGSGQAAPAGSDDSEEQSVIGFEG
jgi:hypothetical protein